MCLVVIDHHSALVGRSIPPDEYKRMCQKQSTKKVRILLMIEADTRNVSVSYCVTSHRDRPPPNTNVSLKRPCERLIPTKVSCNLLYSPID